MKKFLLIFVSAVCLSSCTFFRVKSDRGTTFGDLMKDVIEAGGSGETVKASGTIVTKTLDLAAFKAVDINVPCTMNYAAGTPRLIAEGPDNLLENIDFEVVDSTLNIRSSKHFRNVKKLVINISSDRISALDVRGAVNFNASEGIVSDSFHATIDGAADLNVSGLRAKSLILGINGAGDAEFSGIETDKMIVEIKGAGNCTFSGHAKYANLVIMGAGEIDATGLAADDRDSAVKGMGKIEWK